MAASDDVKTFLQTVITTDEGYLCLLIAPREGNPEEWFKWPEDYDAIVSRILEVQDTNVYFSPHLFSETKSLKTNVLPTRTLVADLDNADVTDLPLNPTILLETSPGRHQGFWVLKDDLALEEFELLSKKLSYTILDCDHSGWPLGHRFRVPGALNFKYDPPPPVRMISSISSERIYAAEEVRHYVRDTDVTGNVSAQDDAWIANPPTTHPQGPRETLEKYKSAIGPKALSYYANRQVDRSEALWHLTSTLFRAGASREDVFWIAKHSANNKFAENRYAGDRDLAKDVVRAQSTDKSDRKDVRSTIALAQKTQGTINDRKRLVTKIAMSDMLQKGEFISTDDGRFWYLHTNAGRPIPLGKRSEQLDALLDTVYDLNASDGFQPYVTNHLLSYTLSKGRRATTGVLSHYDGKNLLLHSGKADVFRITPDSISRHPDGQFGVLFPWRGGGEEPILPGAPLDDGINWCDWMFKDWFTNLLDLSPDQARALVRVWVLFILFRDTAVSRPILALLGQPGSGKSTLFRMIYTLLYGRLKSLNAVSTPDDFDFLVASDPLVVFDNVDTWNNWLPDRLALSASSSDLIKRKLYTDNDTVTLKRQAIVGITAHDPRFGRADVVDRMIILNFQRRENFIPEGQLQDRVYKNRARIWGSIVEDIQKVLAEPDPKNSEIPAFRISDFARMGTRIAKALNIYDEFKSTMDVLRQTQTAFTLSEEDILVDVIKRWHGSRNGTSPDFVSVGHLWETFDALEPSFARSYKSGLILARRLWTVQANLNSVFDIEFKYDPTRGVRLWRIDPRKGGK